MTLSSSESLPPAGCPVPQADNDIAAIKLKLLALLRKDIADIFKKELQETVGMLCQLSSSTYKP